MSIFNIFKKENKSESEIKISNTLEKHKINLEKTIVNLSKEKNVDISKNKANVIFAIDVSGSMYNSFYNGALQKLLNKIFTLALSIDDDGKLKVYSFNNSAKKQKDVDIKNYKNYISYNLNISGGTSYSPVIKLISENENLSENTLIIFITDGDNDDKSKFEEEIRNISNKNCFIQFVGIGNERFTYLEKLDNLENRKVDNTGFEKFEDIYNLSDSDLYLGLLSQYADWLKNKQGDKHG